MLETTKLSMATVATLLKNSTSIDISGVERSLSLGQCCHQRRRGGPLLSRT
jgi:hypothetical protein